MKKSKEVLLKPRDLPTSQLLQRGKTSEAGVVTLGAALAACRDWQQALQMIREAKESAARVSC